MIGILLVLSFFVLMLGYLPEEALLSWTWLLPLSSSPYHLVVPSAGWFLYDGLIVIHLEIILGLFGRCPLELFKWLKSLFLYLFNDTFYFCLFNDPEVFHFVDKFSLIKEIKIRIWSKISTYLWSYIDGRHLPLGCHVLLTLVRNKRRCYKIRSVCLMFVHDVFLVCVHCCFSFLVGDSNII